MTRQEVVRLIFDMSAIFWHVLPRNGLRCIYIKHSKETHDESRLGMAPAAPAPPRPHGGGHHAHAGPLAPCGDKISVMRFCG